MEAQIESIAGALLDPFLHITRPGQRIYWIYLVGATLLAGGVWLRTGQRLGDVARRDDTECRQQGSELFRARGRGLQAQHALKLGFFNLAPGQQNLAQFHMCGACEAIAGNNAGNTRPTGSMSCTE